MHYLITNTKKLENVFTEIKTLLESNPKKTLNLMYDFSHRPKTQAQLGFCFGGLISAIKKHFFEIYGKEYYTDTIKEMLYNECGNTEDLVCPNGKVIQIQTRISRMNVQEMCEFIEKVLNFCDEYGIVLQPELRYLWVHNLSPQYVEEVENTKFKDKDEDYLRYTRSQKCMICGKGNCESHHLKDLSITGLGDKTPDYMTISLCAEHHRNYNGGHITTEIIKKECPFIFNHLTPKQFGKLQYKRYLEHKN